MPKERKWLVVGISGVTCGGKTSFTSTLHTLYPNAVVIHQDTYFLPVEDKRHTLVPNLNHINWEIISSLDMEKMRNDVKQILSRPPSEVQSSLLIIEGFLLFTDSFMSSICQHKLFFTLTHDECWARRSVRTYDPADVPGYFDQIVWPEYERHLQIALAMNPEMKLIPGVVDLDILVKELQLVLDTQLNCEK